MNLINWKNPSDRKKFEEKINISKQNRQKWSAVERLLWVFQILILPCTMAIGFYGTCAYFLYQMALKDESNNRENYFLINYYPFLTSICQSVAFLCVALHSFTDYRKWNLLGTTMAVLCLPIDVYLLYKEPLGPFWTIFGLVATIVPMVIPIADAIFPEEQISMTILSNLSILMLFISLIYIGI